MKIHIHSRLKKSQFTALRLAALYLVFISCQSKWNLKADSYFLKFYLVKKGDFYKL